MGIEFLLRTFGEFAGEEAIVFHERAYTFAWLQESFQGVEKELARAGVNRGTVASLEADFSPRSIAGLLALMARGAIVVPLGPRTEASRESLRALAQVERRVVVGPDDRLEIAGTGRSAEHALYARLRGLGHPGLVLFTSGYTGEPKAALHDCCRLLVKYQHRRHRLRTLLLLLFDHIGGIDTLLQALGNGSAVVIPSDRTPEIVCETVARHRVQVVPAAPSFLTMLLLSEAHRRHDLSSLRFITYGAEVMPEATLRKVAEAFPRVTLLQKYGLTELGTLRSHSRSNDSLWVKVGGEGFQTRVVDGILQIKAESSMVGYLNAPAPFTSDGWFVTGDAVEVDGEYLRILGRVSDLINVGGRKVYPAEVESVLHEVENIAEAVVFGEPHPFIGNIVVARVALQRAEDPGAVERRVRDHCRRRLEPHQVPVKVLVSGEPLHSERQKLARR